MTGHIPRRALSRRMLRLGLIIWLVASTLYLAVLRPVIADKQTMGSNAIIPDNLAAIAVMALPSFALSLLLAIFTLSPHTLATMFKPSRARLLGALGLWVIFPVWAWGALPFSAGYVGGALLMANYKWLFQNGNPPTSEAFAYYAVSLAALLVSYVIACLLSTGLPKWWLRFLGFWLVWWGLYAILPVAGLMASGNV